MEKLGDIMKAHEHVTRRKVDPDSYLLMRLDGKSFSTYTKGLVKPFDAGFMDAMADTLLALCGEIQTVRFGYVQSDEISLLLTPWKDLEPSPSNPEGAQHGHAWMGGVEAKILSISAALATAHFNRIRQGQRTEELVVSGESRISEALALFDARLWTFPATAEGRDLVGKYFLWRQRDAFKNAITMAASVNHSPKQLHGMPTSERLKLLQDTPLALEKLDLRATHGSLATSTTRRERVTFRDGRTGTKKTVMVDRNHWVAEPFMDSMATDPFIPRSLK